MIIQTNSQPKGVKIMSTLQLRKDLTHDESTLVAIATVKEGSSSEPDLTKIPWPLEGHHDVKPEG